MIKNQRLINIVNNGGDIIYNNDIHPNAENYAKLLLKKKIIYIFKCNRFLNIQTDMEKYILMILKLDNNVWQTIRVIYCFTYINNDADLSQQIATNKKFNTKVNIELINTQMDYDELEPIKTEIKSNFHMIQKNIRSKWTINTNL